MKFEPIAEREVIENTGFYRPSTVEPQLGANYGTLTEASNEELHRRNSEEQSVEKKTWRKRFLGIFWAFITGVLYCVMTPLFKYLEGYNSAETTLYLDVSLAIFALPFISLRVRRFRYGRRTIILWCVLSFFSAIAFLSRIMAFQRLPLGDASVIVLSMPLFTAFMARFILKEPLTRFTIISLVLSVVGLLVTLNIPSLMVSNKSTQTLVHFAGCILAFISVLTSSAWVITLRRLTHVHSTVNTFIEGALSSLIMLFVIPFMGGFNTPICTINSWYVVFGCISNFLSIITCILALQVEEATVVMTVFRATDICGSFFSQIVIFSEPIDAYSAAGAVISIISGLIMPLQRWMQNLPDGHRWKWNWVLK